ncbi:hypothetical protein VKT23_001442 [Stygiomarasmius scandens]|uniref:Thioesterase domain-containing protein n=1 Tax=Marasmiellus scandens TaxID=2682957 RepID=A0ABR1JD92_9AGAR
MLSFSHAPRLGEPMTLETVQGNISAEQKKLCERLLAYFVGTSETSYGADIGEGLKLSRIDVYPHPQATDYRNQDQTSTESLDLEARTVCEITVTKKMCNVHGTLHGGCAMYLMDPCSVSALVALGVVAGTDGSGVSQSMFTQWHRPATEGAQLNIISTTVASNGYIRSSRCEIRDRNTNVLYVSCVHSIVNVGSKYSKRSSKGSQLPAPLLGSKL